MTCYAPIQGYRTRTGQITHSKHKAWSSLSKQTISCKQCVGCRLENARQWAIRIMHEASLTPDNNSFITLTYDNQHLPQDKSLDKKHFQDFMKRFREKFAPKKIRFFHCGEYGEKYGRPHYHAIIFNHSFDDKYQWKLSNGLPLYRSPSLESLWTFGHSSVGAVTFESASYVARYVMKKVTGDLADIHYLDLDTGVIKQPEYTTMSRRPGIARKWIEQYMEDTYKNDSVIMRKRELQPPKYYDKIFQLEHPELFENVKATRAKQAEILLPKKDRTPSRLKDRLKVKLAQLKLLKRGLDSND